MALKRALYIFGFLLLASTAGAQINIFTGGNLQVNYSSIRGEENTFKPGFGGGISFVYWEYEYWFIKAGIDYHYKHSSSLEYPDDYLDVIEHPDDKVVLERWEQHIGIPLTIYFRPYESGKHAMLITGSLQPMFAVGLKENSEEFGEVKFPGDEIKSRVKTNLGFGAGYQLQLDKHKFLNIYPSFNFDLRAQRPFNSITLTVEFLFGVY